MSDAAEARALAALPAIHDRLAALIAAPSVSADPAAQAGMEAARCLIEARLAEAGFTALRRLDGGGHPAIYAEWCGAPGRPTLLVYGHYDVQPPDPLDQWRSPPFEATVRDGRVFGRGAADDKGPCLIAIEAMAALLATEGRLPVNVRLLIEGEEEVGSSSLPAILDAHRALLAADAVLSADGARWRPDLPSVNVGSRGSGGLELRLHTAAKDLHSGRYGGIVPNALHAMAGLVAGLHGPDGRIAVPGFYEGVVAPGPAERAALAAIPLDDAAMATEVGAQPHGEAGFTTLERLWLRPCLDVNGLWGGYQGPGSKTVIPSTAHAKITVRLVEGQDPARVRDALRAHLRAACPPWARLEIIEERNWTAAATVPGDHPLLLAAEATLEAIGGTKPLRVRIGASLPLTDMVAAGLGLDTVMFSFATADEDFHAPNECLRLSAIPEGLRAWIALLRRLGGLTPADFAPFRRAR